MAIHIECPACGGSDLFLGSTKNQLPNEVTIAFICVQCNDCDFLQLPDEFYRNNINIAYESELREFLIQNGERLNQPLL